MTTTTEVVVTGTKVKNITEIEKNKKALIFQGFCLVFKIWIS